MGKLLGFVATVSLVAGCAATAVTPVSRNQVIISTSAAPACGVAGAQKVAAKMAAVETLRRGFERFIVGGAQSQNNVRVVNTAPTGAFTTGSVNTFGNTSTGAFNTTFTGGGPVFYGSNDASLLITMFNRGERGFNDAVDARSTLGPDWEEIVQKGVTTCS